MNCVGDVYVFAYKQIIDDKMWYGLHEKSSYIILLIGLKLLWLKISFDDTTLGITRATMKLNITSYKIFTT